MFLEQTVFSILPSPQGCEEGAGRREQSWRSPEAPCPTCPTLGTEVVPCPCPVPRSTETDFLGEAVFLQGAPSPGQGPHQLAELFPTHSPTSATLLLWCHLWPCVWTFLGGKAKGPEHDANTSNPQGWGLVASEGLKPWDPTGAAQINFYLCTTMSALIYTFISAPSLLPLCYT